MFLLLIQFVLFAAVAAPPNATQSATCDTARSRAESSFRQRNNLKTRQQAELNLKRALESCVSTPVRPRLERRLRRVQEEIALTHLQIALFYRRADGVGLLKGALSRLRVVDENYPNFSQMDYVLFLLGDFSDQNGNAQDAANYLRRLIANYPRSSYAETARKKLAELVANGET